MINTMEVPYHHYVTESANPLRTSVVLNCGTIQRHLGHKKAISIFLEMNLAQQTVIQGYFASSGEIALYLGLSRGGRGSGYCCQHVTPEHAFSSQEWCSGFKKIKYVFPAHS